MKVSGLAIGFVLASATLATSATAGEQSAPGVAPPRTADPVIECSKETWPNFSASCLRNANSAVQVRLISGTRH